MRNPAGPRACSPLAPSRARWVFSEHLPTRMGETSLKISSPGRQQPRLVSDAAEKKISCLNSEEFKVWNIIQAPAPTEAQAEVENPSSLQCHIQFTATPSSSLLQTQIPSSQGHFKPKFLMSGF